jgi:alkylated DNA repair protein alkB family protein 1
MRVYGPDEVREDDSFYDRGGRDGRAPVNHTAFRTAERRFKVKNEPLSLGDVLDSNSLDEDVRARRIRQVCYDGIRSDKPVWLYEIVGGGGCCVIPAALDISQQKCWITRSIAQYMSPPNLTNLDAHFEVPSEGLWSFLRDQRPLNIKRKAHVDDSDYTKALPAEQMLHAAEIETLVRRIRWVTLGYQYDWTTKTYSFTSNPIPFPEDLAKWSSDLSLAAGFGEFHAEAGIVNFYQPGDTLTGHVDRSELNMTVPLISLSLGASCIFLLGGAERNDPVLPILLRSGDILVLSGPSRAFYHGVPRILSSHHMETKDEDTDETRLALKLLNDGRININIRQVN